MKKLLSILAIVGVFAASIPMSTATESDLAFSDLDSSDPSLEAIEYLAENGIVEGYEDGTFQSQTKINRAEFMKIIVESLTDDAEGSYCFPDVEDEWFAKYICYGKEIGLVEGYPDGEFKPGNEINFAEASKIIVSAFGLEGGEEGESWYQEYVEALVDQNAVPISISGLDKEIARGEMAEVIWRVQEEVTDLNSLKYEELEGRLVSVESEEEFVELFLSDPDIYDWGWLDYYAEDEVTATSSDSDSGSDSSDDYSSTNVQVENVDEADIVKNDGEYIYMIKGDDDTVRIIDAYPADEMQEVAQIEFGNYFYPYELYLDDDTLVVIGNSYNYDVFDYGFEETVDYYYHSERTSVFTYDIEDRSNPELIREMEFDGYYDDSRKIDDTLYLILDKSDFNYYAYGYDPETIHVEEVLPRYYDSELGEEDYMVECTDIKYLPRERYLEYLITAAIPLDSEDGEIDFEILVGSSENVYSSRDNLYVAATNYDSDWYYYDWSNSKTLIHKFALSEGEIEYDHSGEVQGTILNQFSMDEHDGYFRIATTKGSVWDTEVPSTNNLYILDGSMDVVGSVEGLAPGETIYSARFSGDTGYIVTFKKIDPLFVLDLSDPTNPEVEGELKIPGYSDYLQPYGDDYLIGFGKDAEEASEEEEEARGLDFAWYQGLKISLFDVSDLENPVQLFSTGIGDRGTTSDLLYNHKALLFDEDQGLMAFPVLLAEVEDEDASANTSGEYVYQGAYIYDINLATGFDLQGTITHYDEDVYAESYWYYYYDEDEIVRIIYIGDNFYTISDSMIKASDMDTLEETTRLELQ